MVVSQMAGSSWIETTPTWVMIGVTIFIALFIWILIRVTPGVQPPSPERRAYSEAEITHHDAFLPKYFLGAIVAMLLGGIQMIVKNYPPLYLWLYQAGYGGHMFRDLANTHIIIVGGGTLLLTALVWYTLPRIIQRPLYSDNLAHMAFWFTVAGVFSFYVALSWLGLVEGALVRHGWNWIAARDHIGVYQLLPMAVSSSVMGVGYWCFVGNVFLSLKAARLVPTPKPDGHLMKFFFVGAGGLLIGTVQGVIQVQPDKVVWLHHVGLAGDFIDPISHAHINLVTGVCSLIAGISFYFLPRIAPGAERNRRRENLVFWLLTIGSLEFYLTFLSMGLIEGNIEMNTHRDFLQVAASLGPLHAVPMAVAGICMVTGFWFFMYALARQIARRQPGGRRMPSLFILAGFAALVVGTFQGPLQAFTPIQLWMERAGPVGDQIAQAHAQLNIVSGVMVILMGLTLVLLPELTGRPLDSRLARISLRGVVLGGLGYYAVTVLFSVAEAQRLQQGGNMIAVLRQYMPLQPILMMLAAGAITIGFWSFAIQLYRQTAAYRAHALAVAEALPGRYSGRIHSRVRRRSLPLALALEAIGALAGFPGGGWLFLGHALQGSLLLLLFPAVAWAIIPGVLTPYGGFWAHWGLAPLFLYLVSSAFISTSVLAVTQRGARQRAPRHARRTWSPEEIGLSGLLADPQVAAAASGPLHADSGVAEE